ncbi:MAG: DUF1579 family protein [Planctomycetes bacterium]|nr:DUF1579 family protein [Planctomycetota bacterium]
MRIPVLAFVAASILWLLPQDPVSPRALTRAQQLAAPGEPHRSLQRLVGAWDVVLRTTVPGEKERTDRGTMVAKAILGGRHVVLNFVLAMPGNALEAVQILGYDNLTEQFTASWRDDHSTWAVDCAGSADVDVPERITMRGSMRDARDPGGRPFRLELTLPAAGGDTVTAAIHDTQDGVEQLRQTQQWTRR